MNDLERATTALLDRPVAPPAPMEQIERRAATLRRRRRVFEAGAVALVLVLLGTAGLALSAARDDDQGVFVGEGPAVSSGQSRVFTYRLASPLDGPTSDALQQSVEARFRWFGAGDAEVRVQETDVSVTTQAPADRVDALVTSPGGFELRAVVAEVDASVCDSGAGDDALWTSALTAPPRCLALDPPVALGSEPASESGISLSADGGYQTDLVLTSRASRALADPTTQCLVALCVPATMALITDGAILDPQARLTTSGSAGDVVHVAVPGFTDAADAQLWAAVLVHPLPDGITLTRVADRSTASTTGTSAGETTGTTGAGLADPPLSADAVNEFCLRTAVDASTLAATASALEARFAAIGPAVTVTPLDNQHGQTTSCLGFTTDLDPAHPIYAKDVVANFQPAELHVRQDAWEEVLGESTRSATMLAPDSGMLVISITPDEYAALTSHHPKVCPPGGDCNWLNATVQLGTGSGTAWLEILDGGAITLRLESAADALRWKATIEHPLPPGVAFN